MVDVIFAGGGLANTLAAYRLKTLRPEVSFLLLEKGGALGGNHTWSFHGADLDPAEYAWMKPFVAHSWPRQEVRFPAHSRVLETSYNTVFSERLHSVAAPVIAENAIFHADIVSVAPGSVRLADGREFQGACVVDGRGALKEAPLAVGYQKFLGLEVRTAEPHGQDHPIIMDATVPQTDGYRFIYTLPFAPDRLLIEDTYYSDTPALDAPTLRRECETYAAGRGWRIAEVIREEVGVLPIVLAGDIDAFWAAPAPGRPRSGLRAALFHPTTSYSLPSAVRLADALARLRSFDEAGVHAYIQATSKSHWRETAFYRMLNRMLFMAADPAERYVIFERFYKLSQPLIERFYAGRTTLPDQLRILVGRPPVSILRATRSLDESGAWTFAAKHRAGAAI
ncbi:MAG: lycopene beta-cyclase CrtY [Hyphomicrobiales bacterium]|nr:lycopene beta-cyclase CrtY [Hyphomicrobiales bacterium]